MDQNSLKGPEPRHRLAGGARASGGRRQYFLLRVFLPQSARLVSCGHWAFPARPHWASSKRSLRTFVLEPSSTEPTGRSPFSFWPFH